MITTPVIKSFGRTQAIRRFLIRTRLCLQERNKASFLSWMEWIHGSSV